MANNTTGIIMIAAGVALLAGGLLALAAKDKAQDEQLDAGRHRRLRGAGSTNQERRP